MLSFKPAFSLSFFIFIKRLFSSSLLSVIRLISSAYLMSLIFLQAILIPAYDSSILAFHMMYSAYKLNKQGDSIQPWCTPFPILNQSAVPCKILTVASWSAYRCLKRQVRWSSISISSIIFHSLLWFTQRLSSSQWSKCLFVFFWNSLDFFFIQRMLAIWSLIPLSFLYPCCTFGYSWFMCCWSLAWRILSIILLACEMSSIMW